MYTHRQTGRVENSVRHKSLTLSRLVAENPHKHVSLRARLWNSLFKVNKDLKLLKLILICGRRSYLGS